MIINFEFDAVIFETNVKINVDDNFELTVSVEVGDLEGMTLDSVFETKTEWNVESRNS